MNRWDERYLRDSGLMAQPLELIAEFCAGLAPGRALDLAAGSGRHSLLLAGLGWRVTAVDYSAVALELLAERAAARNLTVETSLADLEKGGFEIEPAGYDLIVDTFYLQRDLFPKIREGLSAGGIALAVIGLAPEEPGADRLNPDYLLQPGELRALFTGFEILHYFEGRREGGPRRNAEIAARRPASQPFFSK